MALSILLAAACGPETGTLFVGTYSDGFFAYDYQTGEPIAKADMRNPSFLALEGNRIYAVSEMPDETAAVYAWRWGGNGFELLGSQPTGLPEGGEDPCHVVTDGERLAVSNYSGGTLAVYTLREDGGIGPLDSLVVSSAGGQDRGGHKLGHALADAFQGGANLLQFVAHIADVGKRLIAQKRLLLHGFEILLGLNDLALDGIHLFRGDGIAEFIGSRLGPCFPWIHTARIPLY